MVPFSGRPLRVSSNVATGRAVCRARSPQCLICPLNKICPSSHV
ncbi:MAG: hypothetical protein HY220_02800 [Candidatus Sungbacteria bacterium]|uniref:Endonuclease III n=1 Tax=Candidatus Sungiibacteriota bacterium TaxID=2750080 RepID=A0A9D6LU19_9BACT|nr:hypothetical protein [Candidatus Sungbacteria bacterium]